MLIVLLVLFIAGAITCAIVGNNKGYSNEGWYASAIICIICAFILLIVIIVAIAKVASADVNEKRIEMYQQENLKMETSMAEAIEKYMEHEYQIFVEISPDEAQTFLIAYPEIQSSELVKYQMETIKTNNEQIKQAQNELLNIDIWKFVLYFG